ncbi:hypothetical protein, partial [Bremerella alba]|uniref:hypothetical protein n=1 Tax=Bremerella alba TaxID=980252 RepID=UPI001A954483
MSQANAQLDPSGSFSSENAPQVVLRAGKAFVCSACGTLVEVPAQVVGRKVTPVEHAARPGVSPVERSQPEPPASDVSANQSGGLNDVADRKAAAAKVSKPKPRRIDGIRVPSAQEMDRALAWVSFHLKLLGLQGGEV